MPTIECRSCGTEILIEEDEYEGTIECPECGAVMYVLISGGVVEEVRLEEEEEEEFEGGFEEEW